MQAPEPDGTTYCLFGGRLSGCQEQSEPRPSSPPQTPTHQTYDLYRRAFVMRHPVDSSRSSIASFHVVGLQRG